MIVFGLVRKGKKNGKFVKKRLYIAVFSYLCMGQGRVVFLMTGLL